MIEVIRLGVEIDGLSHDNLIRIHELVQDGFVYPVWYIGYGQQLLATGEFNATFNDINNLINVMHQGGGVVTLRDGTQVLAIGMKEDG